MEERRLVIAHKIQSRDLSQDEATRTELVVEEEDSFLLSTYDVILYCRVLDDVTHTVKVVEEEDSFFLLIACDVILCCAIDSHFGSQEENPDDK